MTVTVPTDYHEAARFCRGMTVEQARQVLSEGDLYHEDAVLRAAEVRVQQAEQGRAA